MKSANKIILVTLITFVIVTLAVFVNTANAQEAINYTVSISSSSNGVNEASSYTIVITNTGTANIASVNTTVPTGYNNVANVAIPQQPPSQAWNIAYSPPVTNDRGEIELPGQISLAAQSGQGLANGQSVTATFEATNPQVAGTYGWSTTASTMDGATATRTVDFAIAIVSLIPMAEVLLIAAAIAFINTIVNRVLINYFIGWEQYRVMQKEMAEYRSESMAAARSGDQKRMEKVKKKQSQITNMQQKMMKPQMIQIGISSLYLIVWWVVLIPTFGNTSIAYLAGFGALPVIWLYPIFSFFLALISQRLIGVNPIEL